MNNDDLARLAAAAADARRQFQATMASLFDELKHNDPITVSLMIDAFGDALAAMDWFTRPSQSFDRELPCNVLAQGRADDVRDELARLHHSLY